MLYWGPNGAYRTEIVRIRRALAKKGLKTKVGRDFRRFKDIVRAYDRHDLLSQFDPDGVLDKSTASFWMCGFDVFGELMYTQAAELLDLRDTDVASYLAKNRFDYAPASPPVIPRTVKSAAGPKVSRLKGWVVYHGEMWLHPNLRDKATAFQVVRLGTFCSMVAWNPDCIFGLMNWALACGGFNNRIGYTQCEPMTMTWTRSDENIDHQVWAVFADRDDIEFSTGLDSDAFEQKLQFGFR